jgi:hypothetical protein
MAKLGKDQNFEFLACDYSGDKSIKWHRKIEVDGLPLIQRQIIKLLRMIADRMEAELWAKSEITWTKDSASSRQSSQVLRTYQALSTIDSGSGRMEPFAGGMVASSSSQRVKTFGSRSMVQSVADLR